MKRETNRRSFVKLAATAGLCTLASPAVLAGSHPEQLAENEETNKIPKKSWYPLGVFKNPVLESVFLFYVGSTWQRLSDVGECFDTASRIDEANDYSWSDQWIKTGNRLKVLGDACLKEHHEFTAGESYLRSSTYYRAALHHYPDPANKIVKELSLKVVKNYKMALKLMSIPFEAVSIPYMKTELPGYFFPAKLKSNKKAPVIILHAGRDSWAEDYLWVAQQAVKRGYHCLLFDGPGQGKVIRIQGIPFRPDWENVITPVLDFLKHTKKEVDMNKTVLMGFSMGGFLAPRAVTVEKRIKLCVANPGVLNWTASIYNGLNQIDPQLLPLFQAGNYDLFDQKIEEYMRTSSYVKWGITDELWKYGVHKPSELIKKYQEYNIEAVAKNIGCRMMVIDGTGEEFSVGEAKRLYDALTCPKDYVLFTEEDTGYLHCQPGALAIAYTRIFNWVDKYIDVI
ncbi:alpha/beta hydrolase family protein [Pedobacter caeni]|uniref:Alpha/beta hydrolase family protein n=1 Tax=Pedobacter caeni TaxID=288992 RepID=A0A1M4VFC0_9SPHI|nr:alpha/beta fold hydrolase [Pedobacter caeni]SHE67706.1 Alpha/beta hydrolase family protein [Pedobacter caeni]